MAWRRICHDFLSKNPGRVITRYDFSSLFSEAWVEAMTPRNILAGFRVTGVYPFNRNAFDLDSEERKETLSEKTGLSYIPLYTPSKSLSCSQPTAMSSTRFPSTQSASTERYQPSYRQKPLMKLLALPSPAARISVQRLESKTNDRVLTSGENLKKLREKENAKLEKMKQKEERARRRQKKGRKDFQEDYS